MLITGHRDGRVRLWQTRHQRQADGFSLALQLAHTLVVTAASGIDTTPVSCVALSSDQRRLYSGDWRGRVFLWCLPDAAGKDHWIKDSLASACMGPVCDGHVASPLLAGMCFVYLCRSSYIIPFC